jgi:ribosomal-protein-alanine N-acetyltransferase
MVTLSDLRAEFRLRTMRSSDLDLVVQNEVSSYDHPWTKRIFIDCLRAGYQCWVLASKDKIVGHGVMSVAIGECHVLTLCVHPEYQRAGHGKRILKFLLEKASREEAKVCYLEVRSSNEEARALYNSVGFLPIGERKNYYPSSSGREDAIIMSLSLVDY